MPVEAIHLSALSDALRLLALPQAFATGEVREAARLGAVAIDFPYFDRFAISVARYYMKLPTATSHWGDLFHETRPVGVCKELLRQARMLRASAQARQSGERLLAFALGYVSHVAVDRALHPLVNELARARAERLADSPLRQHTEVEKFQSVLFHEERLGFDFMGRPALRQHISVDTGALTRDFWLCEAYRSALARAVGEAPTKDLLARWTRGYAQYTWLVSSPAGKTLVPEKVKRLVRAEVYDGPQVNFAAAYATAVEGCKTALAVALDFAESESMQAPFDTWLPEGPIDGS